MKSRISAAEEEQVERESVLLEVQKELEETKVRLNECEEQNTNKLDQLNKLLLSEQETSERQMYELKARYVDLENTSDDQSATIEELKESLACCDEKVKSFAENEEEKNTSCRECRPQDSANECANTQFTNM